MYKRQVQMRDGDDGRSDARKASFCDRADQREITDGTAGRHIGVRAAAHVSRAERGGAGRTAVFVYGAADGLRHGGLLYVYV